MSNVGQAALVIVGTVVGYYIGYPQLGFVLGSLAGNALFPTQLPGQSGPRLSDNQTTSSVIGNPVPIVFGTAAVAGCYMWLAKINEITNTEHVGGKGGPEQTNTTYSYTQSIAVGLCEGPIAGMSRVWENGKLVYDIRPQLAGESDTDYANRLTVAAAYAETFTLHLGDEDQMPDATIESVEGVGEVPGFRGLAYIVYPDRKLREDQALRHPSFKFEVYETGVGNCTDATEYGQEALYPWNLSSSDDPRDSRNVFLYRFQEAGSAVNNTNHPDRGTIAAAVADAGAAGFNLGPKVAWGDSNDWGERVATDPLFVLPSVNTDNVAFFYNRYPFDGTPVFTYITPGETVNDFINSLPNGTTSIKWWSGGQNGTVGSPSIGHGVYRTFGGFSFTPDESIRVFRRPAAPPDPCEGLPPAPIAGYCIREDGKYVKGNAWILDDSQNYNVLTVFSANAFTTLSSPNGPALPATSPAGTSAFWTAAYNDAVTAGKVPAGWTYGVQYPATQAYGYTMDLRVCDGAGAGVTIGAIIRAICKRCGYAPTDIDASDMDAVTVDGYSVANISAGRDILTPLRSVGFFDCVESGDTLKFVARGKAIVDSLTYDDFGAFDGAASSVPGPAITTTKAQDADLPRQTRVHYFATSRDYEAGEQLSPMRITTTAVNVMDVELAVCMNDTQAAKIADVIWSDAWAERWGGTLAVDQAMSHLEPGDCIEVPVDGVTRRIRIVNETIASGVLRTLNYVRDDDGAYISHAVAAAPDRIPQKLKLLSATDLELLDLPALLDSDNDAGIYAAARGADTGWSGCVIFRSADGGATFAQLGSIVNPTPMGTLNAAVTASDWHTWDDATTITVNVSVGVTFESRTDAAVLTGANAAAMGANGRWEIVQFANATQLSPTQWRLSRLLRGRRGTEYNISSSQTNDKFVMISAGTLARLPLQTSEIGANRVYKAVSIGASYASGIDQTFAGQAVALRPFSPVFLTAERDTAGDIVLHWTRRGRLGRTLMSGVDIPLSEASESYSVDIYSHTVPHTVVRTIAASTQTAIYSAAHQTTDFGSDTEASVMVAVYQISATVGRGTPDLQLLTIS